MSKTAKEFMIWYYLNKVPSDECILTLAEEFLHDNYLAPNELKNNYGELNQEPAYLTQSMLPSNMPLTEILK